MPRLFVEPIAMTGTEDRFEHGPLRVGEVLPPSTTAIVPSFTGARGIDEIGTGSSQFSVGA